jgi:hypothetical protein
MQFVFAVILFAVYGIGCFVLGDWIGNRALRQDNKRSRRLYREATKKIARLETKRSAPEVPSEDVSCAAICTHTAAPAQARHQPRPKLKVGDRVRVAPDYRRSVWHPGDTGTVISVLAVRMDRADATLQPTFYPEELELLPRREG